jgi:glycosyltransferase involved in cell wall biosynthesis
MKLSVIVPVYNENGTVRRILEVIRSVPVEKEILVIDDGSTDGTRETLKSMPGQPDVRILFHEKNMGKGAAVKTGIREAKGDVVIIQDADLEYDPMDYLPLLDAMRESGAQVVYGSRFLGKKNVSSFWHRGVNKFLTGMTNVLYGSRLTDMETCYKLYKTPFLRSLDIRSEGFELEVELAAKTLLRGADIEEVPVSYKGRSFHEGKKIGWKDGFKALYALVRHRFK